MERPTATIPIPPLGGFTIDDLADLDLPGSAHLIHGGLYIRAARQRWHSVLSHELAVVFVGVAPNAVVFQNVAVRLDPKHAPQPDILVVRRDTYDGDATSYPPDVVIIAVEIMSSDQRKDRVVRPDEYAIAGIPHYWRIERTPEKRLIAYTYELDPVNLKYVETAVHHGRLTTDQPWPLDCDLHGLATP